MIEGILQKMDLSRGLALLINSPGGIGISAERIINTCRSYSGTNEFIAIVPGKAKSAATMLCMGASSIYMSKTSELGPIDPQTTISRDGNEFQGALVNIVKSYEALLEKAVNSKGRLEPFLLGLSAYDPRQIQEFKTAIELSEDVALRALSTGMMNGQRSETIRKKISPFLSPERSKSHGRSIFHQEAQKCGLTVNIMDLKSKLWDVCYELYLRLDHYTMTRVAKCIENKDHSFAFSAPRGQ